MSKAVNSLWQLRELGQSVWLEGLNRDLVRSGELARLIDSDAISGVRFNLRMLERAIAEDPEYRVDIRRRHAGGAAPRAICEQLVLQDVRDAADVLHRVYQRSGGLDGLVSMEMPLLADDPSVSVAEARRLWRALDRPNAMIAVPTTRHGLAAVRRLISEGINVNATPVFGVTRYREVLDSFAAGLEDRKRAGDAIDRIASVASVLVGRIDTLVDGKLSAIRDAAQSARAHALLGKAGTEVARFAYQDFKKFSASPRWGALTASGAHPQRLLWASTGTKNPAYNNHEYVDELIGRDTVTMMSLATLAAYRDHGRPAPRLEKDLYDVAALPSDLLTLRIDLEQISRQLEAEGVSELSDRFNALISSISELCEDR